MIIVNKTDTFSKWLDGLKDITGRARILARIKRMEQGHLGDVKPVGDGVHEMKFTFGPGYRSYYFYMMKNKVVLLNGGDKSSQSKDIKKAKDIVAQIKGNHDE